MNFKEFLFPSKEKIGLLILALLIFGAPATMHSCPGFLTEVGASMPPCIERFNIYPTIAIAVMSIPALDASTSFEFNPLIVGTYVLALYIAISILFHLVGQSVKKSALAIVGIALLLLVLAIVYSFFSSITYVF